MSWSAWSAWRPGRSKAAAAPPGFVQVVGTAHSAGSATTLAIPVSVTTTAGNTVLVGVRAASRSVTSVTDSKSNAYTVDVNQTVTPSVHIARAHLTAALASGDTITVHLASATTAVWAGAAEYAGIVATAPLVGVTSRRSTTSASVSSATVTPSSGTKIVWFSVWTPNAANLTGAVTTPFTRRATDHATLPGAIADYYVASAAARHVTWTTTTGHAVSVALAAYKAG